MPQFKLLSLEVVASYNAISDTFAMRPSPRFIATEIDRLVVSPELDLEEVLTDLQVNPINEADIDAAKLVARDRLQARLNTDGIDIVPSVVYRPGTGGIHDIGVFLTKVSGSTKTPWEFSITIQGQVIEGFVYLSLLIAPSTVLAMSVSPGGQAQTPVAKPKSVTARPVAPHTHAKTSEKKARSTKRK